MNGTHDIADRSVLSGGKNETIALKTTGAGAIDTTKPGNHKVKVIVSDPNSGITKEETVTIKIAEAPLKLSSYTRFSSHQTIAQGENSAKVHLE